MIISNVKQPQKIELVRNKNYVTWRDCFRVENSVTAHDTFRSFYCFWFLQCRHFVGYFVRRRTCLIAARRCWQSVCTRTPSHGRSSLCALLRFLFLYFPVAVHQMAQKSGRKKKQKKENHTRCSISYNYTVSLTLSLASNDFVHFTSNFSISIGHCTPSRPFCFFFAFSKRTKRGSEWPINTIRRNVTQKKKKKKTAKSYELPFDGGDVDAMECVFRF